MNNLSKGKITAGYILLLAALLFSLSFVYREMGNLMSSDDNDLLRTDSLITLLKEKDANTIRLLRTLSEANEGMISARDVENIIAEQDSTILQQRVQHRVISHRDTILTKQEKKGFFRRLGEVFVPPKKDTAVQVQTSLEFSTDTLLETYNPADSLHEKLRDVRRRKKAEISIIQRRKKTLQHFDRALTARIDSLLKGYEQETLERAQVEAAFQQSVRRRSAGIIGGIAIGGVLLAAVFLILIWRDIARSNRYRSQLEEANRRAESLLVSREKLMLAITHDFKAPLGSIMGYADLLSRLTVNERQRFYLDNMKISSEHLLKLVSDLLDFHRLDLQKAEVNRVTFHPSRLLEEIRVSFEPLVAAKGLFLHCTIDPVLQQTFISDPLRLRQILNNLLSNAVKFTNEGGLTLTADFVPRSASSSSVGDHLKVMLADTGKGMNRDDRERIFQEFTRLPGAQGEEGFGLGLSIVRMLVQLLEGSIEVDSELGKGSVFTLQVPLYPVAIDAADSDEEKNELSVNDEVGQTPNLSEELVPAPIRVLLIDDDRIQLTLTAAMLSEQGIAAVCCQELDELLEALQTDTFDVLLTDVQMPALNGFDLLKLLRASNIAQAKSMPIIAVTARSDMEAEDFLKQGFSGCLHKPFTTKELISVLQKIDPCDSEMGSHLPEPVEVPCSSVNSKFNFSALTAFSGNDVEASNSIMKSFITETRINIGIFQQAIDKKEQKQISAIAHKMLPIFTLLGDHRLIDLLKELEALDNNSTAFSREIREKGLTAIRLIEEIVEEAVKVSAV